MTDKEDAFDKFFEAMLERAAKLQTVDELMALIRDSAAAALAQHREEMKLREERRRA